MNIFVLDRSPKRCAQYHNDKHVVKMILESAQLLMSAYHLHPVPKQAHAIKDPNMYKLTHAKHPCTLWVNKSIRNWQWLRDLLFELNEEYKLRYNAEDHLSFIKLKKIVLEYGEPMGLQPTATMTPFALAMPEELRESDPVISYRKYYMRDKQHLSTWSPPRSMPNWFRLSSV